MINRICAAIDHFGALVRGVPADKWNAQTPCSEWTVSDLVNHLVSEHSWVPHIFAGETLEEVGDRYDGDLVGSDPVGAWERAAVPSRAAWKNADLTETAQFSFGEAPLTEYADQMLVDLTVHSWDLARATGQDETIDPSAVEHSLAYARANVARWDGLGIMAPPVPTASSDLTVQLICLTGRTF